MGGLIGINDIKTDATIARNTVGDSGIYYYTLIPASVRKCSYLITILEDRSRPKIYVVSKYDINYKSDYNVSPIINEHSLLTIKFYYNNEGDIIIKIDAKTRSSLITSKLLVGDTRASIKQINPDSSDLIEISIS